MIKCTQQECIGVREPVWLVTANRFSVLRSRKSIAIAAAAILAGSLCLEPALAESPAELLKRFGLMGTWAADCKSPPARLNFYENFFADSGGLARRDVDRGTEISIATSYIDAAEMVSPNKLKGRIRNADPNWETLDKLTYDVVFVKENDPQTGETIRYRVLESLVSDGRVIAKNGILLRLGKPTFWEYRCRSPATS
jgi:hypothetical protein